MSPRLDAACTVISPAGRSTVDASHEYGLIFRVANATASFQATAADIPANCRGRYWRLLVKGLDVNTPVDVQWAWLLDADGVGGEDTAPTLLINQVSVTGTGHLAAAQTLLDRQPEHIYCPSTARGLVCIMSSTGGFFEASLSGWKTGK